MQEIQNRFYERLKGKTNYSSAEVKLIYAEVSNEVYLEMIDKFYKFKDKNE